MPKTKKSGRRGLDLDEYAPDDVDSRPITSLYTGTHTLVICGNGTTLKVLDGVLCNCPKLQSLKGVYDSIIRLDIPETVGHVIIHHLSTGSYQCLRPKGSSSYARHCAEFGTSVQAYAAAQTYELPALAEQARREIERLGARLSLPKLIDVLVGLYPNPKCDDGWMRCYLQSRIKALFTNSAAVTAFKDGYGSTNETSIIEFFFANIVECIVPEETQDETVRTESDEGMAEPLAEAVPELELKSELGHAEDFLEPGQVDSNTEEAMATPPGYDTESCQAVPLEPYEIEAVSTEDADVVVVESSCSMEEPPPIELQNMEESLPPTEELQHVAGDWFPTASSKRKSSKRRLRVGPQICESRTDHILDQGWEDCVICREYVRQLSEKLDGDHGAY